MTGKALFRPILGFTHWVITAGVERMAFHQPPDRQEHPFGRAETLNRFQSIGRACGRKTARGKGQRGEEVAIKANEAEDDSNQHPEFRGATAPLIILSILQ